MSFDPSYAYDYGYPPNNTSNFFNTYNNASQPNIFSNFTS